MENSKKPFLKLLSAVIIFFAFCIGGVGGYFFGTSKNSVQGTLAAATASAQISSACPTPTQEELFRTYTVPKILPKDQYQIVMVGDSMTKALGPRGGTFNSFLNDLYKKHSKYILVDNYAQGATNILSLKDQINTQTTYWDSTFEPLLSRDFDLILIESFGYNPLSQYPLEEGLKAQTKALDEVIKILMTTHPNAAIMLVATIAPNKTNYAKTFSPNYSVAERTLQAEERMAYIKNHISYARSHNIPLVNIYEKSLTNQGDGNLEYINPSDYIHPSFTGVDFIGAELANIIYDTQILPR